MTKKKVYTHDDVKGASMPGRRFYKEYKTWQRIIGKCHNPRHTRYDRYGGRGFVFDDFYRYSFLNFLNEVGECPEPKDKYTIERIENDKGYVTGNMKWIVSELQAINKSTNRIIEYQGKKLPLAVWCRDLGLVYNTVSTRLRRGLTFEQAVMENPPLICGNTIYKGEILSLTGFSKSLGLNYEKVCRLHTEGFTGDEIAEMPEAKKIVEVRKFSYMGATHTLPVWAKKLKLHVSTLRDKLKSGYSFQFLCDFYLHNKRT